MQNSTRDSVTFIKKKKTLKKDAMLYNPNEPQKFASSQIIYKRDEFANLFLSRSQTKGTHGLKKLSWNFSWLFHVTFGRVLICLETRWTPF